ncbi:hypothetical protein KUTeg_003044 [Tegillarca granosa]|uniref:Uncharacterized protein n=1 Tax=Tegillarca granosa TaxID=220873 RepID=A0ABQ9FQG9_TEGGR|nr:hypothetical protein KUTeg_003044 [Tegillarca granosa]
MSIMDGDGFPGLSPKRERLVFLYDAAGVSREMEDVMNSIKQLAESMLFHWKSFPIVLPPSITDVTDPVRVTPEGEKMHKGMIHFQNLFIAPTFDELEEVATDRNGALKKLTDSQLQSIWNNGEFEVPSNNFPGQVHVWRLTQLLQKGTNRANNSLLKDLALSLRLLIITARNRFNSHFFSIKQSVKGLGKGLWKILDILIGMPATAPGDVEAKIQDEHMKYLVAELDIKPNCRKEFETFCNYVKEKCAQLLLSDTKTSALHPPPIPYSYQTPSGLDIDLRLFNKDLINNCLPILSSILERGARGWHIQFRKKLMRDLQGKGLTKEEINKRVNEAIMDEYLDRVFNAICTNTELENLQQGVGNLLVAQAKAVLAMKKAVRNVQVKMIRHKEKLVAHLNATYPVKSRIQAWMNEQIEAFETDFISQNLWSAHEEAISICEEEDLKQAVYFLKRDLNFIKERESVLLKELVTIKIPRRRFTFSTRIWMPRNYIITKIHGNRRENIPTVITKNVSSLQKGKNENISFTATRYHRRMTSTRYPFWRWLNYLHRTWSWMWNSIFFFGVIVPWCSQVSLRALFYSKPFYPDLELSQYDGSLFPKESVEIKTFSSLLRSLWVNVWNSRTKFEEAPDRGFLGKSLTRHLNRFWNIILKGAVGSVLLCVCYPVLCVLGSGASILVAVTAPAWIPVVTLVVHVGFFLVFDADCPDDSNKFFTLFEAIIWRILILGCIQPVAALVSIGLVRRMGRGIWDSMMFCMVIKSRGRVPSSDGFVARRVSGPGLASNFCYQINPEQALAALEARMERDELEAWKSHVISVIKSPVQAYSKFVHQCFSPFSAMLSPDGVYKKLDTETSQYLKDLTFKVQKREEKLNTGLHPAVQRKIKLPERELKVTILQSAKMIEDFYPKRVFPKLNIRLACRKLVEVFTSNFLIPLEETDNLFELKVDHINLGRYVDMLRKGEFHDDLDLVTEVHTPAGEETVKAPHLDAEIFDPNHVYTSRNHTPLSRSKPWKRMWKNQVFDKLQIPLPISHPASIALSIYNREHDSSPINIDDVYCQRIIRATKETKKRKAA